MFWLGLFVGAVLGANVGVLVMALFQHGKQKTDG
jgi:hypothetical protein